MVSSPYSHINIKNGSGKNKHTRDYLTKKFKLFDRIPLKAKGNSKSQSNPINRILICWFPGRASKTCIIKNQELSPQSKIPVELILYGLTENPYIAMNMQMV